MLPPLLLLLLVWAYAQQIEIGQPGWPTCDDDGCWARCNTFRCITIHPGRPPPDCQDATDFRNTAQAIGEVLTRLAGCVSSTAYARAKQALLRDPVATLRIWQDCEELEAAEREFVHRLK